MKDPSAAAYKPVRNPLRDEPEKPEGYDPCCGKCASGIDPWHEPLVAHPLSAEGDADDSPALFDVDVSSVARTSDDCYTPRWVFDAMGLRFDLDVAAPVGGPWHVPCDRYYTAADDGLTAPWDGLVWCNPPYSNYAPWAARWATHDRGVLVGLATARSRGRRDALRHADAVAFIDPKFERDGQPPRDIPQVVFVAFRGVGVEPAERLAAADKNGAVLYGLRDAS